jgi:DegV family protein with EDD domain
MVKIVTDSSSDLTPDQIKEFDITTVPLFARFGDEIFRERIDLTDEQFYDKLINGNVFPATIQPNPQDFVDVYQKVTKDADAIVSIHISNKLSGTLNSAFQAKDIVGGSCPIELVDSQTVTVALGLIVLAAARVAKQGGSLQEVLDTAKEASSMSNAFCLLDTLKYLEKGGRIGKAKALVGTLLNVKPIISIKDGEVIPYSQVRSRTKGLDQVIDIVKKSGDIKDMAVAYSTTPDDANALAERLSPIINNKKVNVYRMGTTLGIHTGPGSLVVAILAKG